jgi:hypothetical protein
MFTTPEKICKPGPRIEEESQPETRAPDPAASASDPPEHKAVKTWRGLDEPGPFLTLSPTPGNRAIPGMIRMAHTVPNGHPFWQRRAICFTARNIAVLTGPLVYAWVRDSWTVLYVGLSRHGLRRVFALGHAAAKQLDPRRDWLMLWPCDNINAAERFERNLIREERPQFNKLWNPNDPRWRNGFRGQKKTKPRLGKPRVPDFRSSYWRRRPLPAKVTRESDSGR